MATCVVFSGGDLQIGSDDPATCPAVMLSGAEYAQFQMLFLGASSFDSAQASAAFSFFFGVTLAAWLLAKKVGLILQAIRRF